MCSSSPWRGTCGRCCGASTARPRCCRRRRSRPPCWRRPVLGSGRCSPTCPWRLGLPTRPGRSSCSGSACVTSTPSVRCRRGRPPGAPTNAGEDRGWAGLFGLLRTEAPALPWTEHDEGASLMTARPLRAAGERDRVPDAVPGNWVDRLAPNRWKPYLRLARFDRPIGAWLLLFPAWWGQALAEHAIGRPYPNPWYLLLFLLGAFIMRGAGCTYNDIVDREFDARVARTAARPIPSGQVRLSDAFVFLAVLCAAGLVILLQ